MAPQVVYQGPRQAPGAGRRSGQKRGRKPLAGGAGDQTHQDALQAAHQEAVAASRCRPAKPSEGGGGYREALEALRRVLEASSAFLVRLGTLEGVTATLTFTLPTEATELAAAQHGARYASALANLRQDLRTKRKHGHSFATADEALEWMADRLNEEILDATDVDGAP